MHETQGAFRRQLWRQGILLALRLQRVFMTGISFVEFFTIDLLFAHACLAVKRWLTFKRILNASANGGRNLDKLNLTLFALRCRDSDDFVELAAEFAHDIA